MTEPSFLLRKDALGWKVAQLADDESYDGAVFTLATGEKVGKENGWLADPENVLAMVRGQPLKNPEDLTVPEMNESELVNFLKKLGRCVDHEMRVRRFLSEPFTKLLDAHVGLMVVVHQQACGGDEDKMAKTLLTLGWFDGKIGIFTEKGPVVFPDGDPPEGVDKGELVLFRDRVGRDRLLLRWHDWYLAPKVQAEGRPICVLELFKYADPERVKPSGATSVKELLGTDWILTPEGLMISKRKFVAKASFQDLSIEGFLNNGGGT